MKGILQVALCVVVKFLVVVTASGLYLDESSPAILGGASHECYRECIPNDNRICYYEFALVEWSTMSSQCGDCPYTVEDCFIRGCVTAGGDIRGINVVNHMLPGPSVQVCEGDIIQVNLTNNLIAQGTTIHWHGISQTDTSYMDGVPFVTQCPILPGNTFLYDFTADPAGTHIWHAHSGVQDSDGFYGPVIIRTSNDVNAPYYDYDFAEHVMIIWHWYATPTIGVINTRMYTGSRPIAYSLTINGLAATLGYEQNNSTYYTPRANFTVIQGYRYRFRAIENSVVNCPVQVSVDDHTLTMIASDGAPFEPVEVASFIINAGERYDFVLNADQEIGNYWIRYRGLGLCETAEVSAEAILHYEGADNANPTKSIGYNDANRIGVLLNPINEANTDYSNNTLVRVSSLKNTWDGAQDVSGIPDLTLYIPFTLSTYEDFQTPGPYAQINNTSYKALAVPLLTQHNEITSDMYCTQYDDSAKKCHNGYCTCPYVYEIPKDSLVEIFLIDATPSGRDEHPVHFHGNYLQIVAAQAGNSSDITVSEVQALNEAGLISKNFEQSTVKDVFGVPTRGFVALRFIADNPGYWFFHCHIGSHLEEGMGAILKVGEHSEMVQAPVDFPTCSGSYDITRSCGITAI